jgi:hypothetical protein|nr:MAG TPA: hypothetical protein [Caudoviricetes sp.]
MGKIGDSKARKAAEILKKYCNEHKYCQNCLFAVGKKSAACLLVNKLPFDWVRY